VPSDALPEGPVDEVVVGAGITGLATGNTTAKLSLLQGTKFSRLCSSQSRRVAGAYLDANREGMEWLLGFCEDHGVALQRRPAFTYAVSEGELSTVRKEYDAAQSPGPR
jgi:L-2-hydroxyglutarate oxidase LhgO